ncbi:MAG: hypothetical protein O7C75_11270, partial [Verrucomicrobia bacterium]|nr:hypothetical protein [Verrucomicrobiota bacterium]
MLNNTNPDITSFLNQSLTQCSPADTTSTVSTGGEDTEYPDDDNADKRKVAKRCPNLGALDLGALAIHAYPHADARCEMWRARPLIKRKDNKLAGGEG